MPKRLIKKLLPNRDSIREHKHLQLFGRLMHDANLWHMNRRSISGGFAAGLFWAFIPIPLQMLAAAASAILFRVNLPLSVALVWITNPLTMPPIFFINYKVGCWLLDTPESNQHFEISMYWLAESVHQVWKPLYLGSIVLGLLAAVISFVVIRILWRIIVVSRYRERRQQPRRSSSD